MMTQEAVECAYCGCEWDEWLFRTPGLPAVDDDAAWEAVALAHGPGCEWVVTRAFRRCAPKILWSVAEIRDAVRGLAGELRDAAVRELERGERWAPADFLPHDLRAIYELADDADLDRDEAIAIAWPIYSDLPDEELS